MAIKYMWACDVLLFIWQVWSQGGCRVLRLCLRHIKVLFSSLILFRKIFFESIVFFSVHFMDKNGRSTIGNCLCTIRKALCCIKSINKEIKTVFLFYALSFAFNNCLTSDHTIIWATKWNRILLPFGIVTYMNFKCIFLLIPKMFPITAINGDRLVYENICTNRYDKLNFNSSFLWRVVSAYNCVLIFINFFSLSFFVVMNEMKKENYLYLAKSSDADRWWWWCFHKFQSIHCVLLLCASIRSIQFVVNSKSFKYIQSCDKIRCFNSFLKQKKNWLDTKNLFHLN